MKQIYYKGLVNEEDSRYKSLKSRRNQIQNISNSHQEFKTYTPVLFVCSAGLLRSATSCHIFCNEPYNWNTRSVGSDIEYAINLPTEALMIWAKYIFVMEDHCTWNLRRLFGDEFINDIESKIFNLNVPDIYGYRDPDLINFLRVKMDLLKEEGVVE